MEALPEKGIQLDNDGTTAPTRERKPGHAFFPINSQANSAIPAVHVWISARAAARQLGVAHRTFMKWVEQDSLDC